jgi:DNA phosphorothioation-dependent restriction protein DptG
MEMEYTKKDIKKSPKMKKEKFNYDDSGKRPLWSFILEGEKHSFAKKEDAEIAYARLTK